MNLRSYFDRQRWGSIRIAAIYMLLGILWILFSDQVAALIARDESTFAKISLYKGWGYVIVTALLLQWLIQRYTDRLYRKDELQQLTAEMAKVGGWEFDAQTLQGTWTDEVARIHDLDPGLPTNVELGLSFYTGESRKKIDRAVNEAIQQARSYDLELELISAKGVHKWIRTMALPVVENGKVVKVRGIFQDITERKMIEASLKESEERFRSLYENSTIGLYRTTPDGRILLCNPTLLQMLGYESFEELAQRNLEEEGYEPGYERSEFRQRLDSQGEVRGFESAWSRRDGSTVHVRESAKAIKDSDGKVRYYEGTVEDITERKRAEQEIETLARFSLDNPYPILRTTTDGRLIYANPPSRRLLDMWGCEIGDPLPDDWRSLISDLVASGSDQVRDVQCNGTFYSIIVVPLGDIGYVNLYGSNITERKLMEEELKRSNAELEQFAYVASHDLQEPLRAVTGMVHLLRKQYQGKLDERGDEYIEHAVEAAGRMRKLINDLLDYSRVDRRGSQFEQTNFENALDVALANLQIAVQESDVTITRNEMPALLADATQITQVFQNLIGNAIKFRDDEQPLRVHIGAQEMDDAWRFEVRDNGIGIEPHYFDRIFGVFQRLHTHRDYPGTGIGLSLCKKIVERHGGRIWVESEPGRGSSFYFTIPRRR